MTTRVKKRLRKHKKTYRKTFIMGSKKNAKKYQLVFGHISMEGCHYCKNMEDDWQSLCLSVRKKKTPILLYDIAEDHQSKIDAFNSRYATNLEYTGVPTIFKLSLRNGNKNIEYYNGERTHSEMEKWLLNTIVHEKYIKE